jgi:hypothetical protein
VKTISRAIACMVFTIGVAACVTYIEGENPTLPTTPAIIPIQELTPELTLTPSSTPFRLEQSATSEVHEPISSRPKVVAYDQGPIWKECVIPDRDYYFIVDDIEDLTRCFEIPEWNTVHSLAKAERIMGENGSDLRLVIGDDVYEAKHDSSEGCCDYELLKDGEVIIRTSAPFITFDPNINLYEIGGKLAWELISEPPVVFYDGENLNDQYDLQGSYYPYEIQGKLIFIAKLGGQYKIFYNGEVIGPVFDDISMAYCCGKRSVAYGDGKYWFIGKREGVRYVVLIE